MEEDYFEVDYVFDPGVVPVMPDKDDPDPILPMCNRFGKKRNCIVKELLSDDRGRACWSVESGGNRYIVHLDDDAWEPNG